MQYIKVFFTIQFRIRHITYNNHYADIMHQDKMGKPRKTQGRHETCTRCYSREIQGKQPLGKFKCKIIWISEL